MNEFEQLKAQVAELMEFKRRWEANPIPYPANDLTKAALGVLNDRGSGSTGLTDTLALTGNAQNINVPKAYTGTELIDLGGGVVREFPYVS